MLGAVGEGVLKAKYNRWATRVPAQSSYLSVTLSHTVFWFCPSISLICDGNVHYYILTHRLKEQRQGSAFIK
jgi:hypothetical protein